MTQKEKIEYATLRMLGAKLFGDDVRESTKWKDAVRELRNEKHQ